MCWKIEKKRDLNRRLTEKERENKSLRCIIWQGTSLMLSDGGVRMISLTHTQTFSLRLFLFPLVSFQSRDQPLADRTGPLGSCYRLPQRRDWKALIAALRSPQSWENHSISVIGSPTWDRRKRGKEGRQNERQVRHLLRVKEGKQRGEGREGMTACQREIFRETKGKKKCVSLCLTVYMLFTRGDRSR